MSQIEFHRLLKKMNNRPKTWNDVHKRVKEVDVVEAFGGLPEVYTVLELYKDDVLPPPGTVFRRAAFPQLLILRTPKGHEYLVATDGGNYARNAAILIREK